VHGPPFVLEDREVQLIAPAALEPFVLHEMRLLAHAEAAGYAGRRVVVGIEAGGDAMQAEIIEGEMEELVRSLRGVPVAGVGGVKHVTDLSAPMLGGGPDEEHIADELSGSRELDAEGQPLACVLEHWASPHPAYTLAHHLGVHRIERHVPADLRQRSVGDERVHISL
jgi:hypothetical protein